MRQIRFLVLILWGLTAMSGCKGGGEESKQSELLLNLSIHWVNPGGGGASTGAVELKVLDAHGAEVGDSVKDVAANTVSDTTNTDEISCGYPETSGSSYAVTMLGCTVTNGTGTISASGSYPTVGITCN